MRAGVHKWVLKVEQTAGEWRTHGNYRTGSVDVCHLGQSVKTRFRSNKLLTMRTRRRSRKRRRERGMGTRLVSPPGLFWFALHKGLVLPHDHLHSEGKNGRWKQFKAFLKKKKNTFVDLFIRDCFKTLRIYAALVFQWLRTLWLLFERAAIEFSGCAAAATNLSKPHQTLALASFLLILHKLRCVLFFPLFLFSCVLYHPVHQHQVCFFSSLTCNPWPRFFPAPSSDRTQSCNLKEWSRKQRKESDEQSGRRLSSTLPLSFTSSKNIKTHFCLRLRF